MHWDPRIDNFGYHTHISESSIFKRKVLSVIARSFDPVGALRPMLMWAKVFMQELWCDQLDWDSPLPDDLKSSWAQFLCEFPSIFSISILQHIDVERYDSIQFIGFADASKKGYAATVYLRVVHLSRWATVTFVTCRTKVAPLKTSRIFYES